MKTVIDFHTHILPNTDDGSSGVDMSLEMLRREAEQGVRAVVLTPHFYADNERPERFLDRRGNAAETLARAIGSTDGFPEIFLGAEVHYFEGISDCEYLPQLKIEGTDCIMVEMPMRKWNERMLSEICDISQKQGLTPIIAHIDRYIGTLNQCVHCEELTDLPVWIQASTEFFIKRTTRKRALKMLRNGEIHLLGSDCHNMTKRPPDIDEATSVIRHALGDGALEYIKHVEEKIFNI